MVDDAKGRSVQSVNSTFTTGPIGATCGAPLAVVVVNRPSIIKTSSQLSKNLKHPEASLSGVVLGVNRERPGSRGLGGSQSAGCDVAFGGSHSAGCDLAETGARALIYHAHQLMHPHS